jgi:RNAse (barnase) inhibitor barstar
MFSNKVAGIFILIFILIFSGCTNSSEQSIPEHTQEQTPVTTQTLIKPVETPWWDDKTNYHYGVIEPENNLFEVKISGVIVDEDFTNNYKVYNELQREIFIHQEYGPDDLDTIEVLLIEQYGSPVIITFEKFDSNNDNRLDVVAVKYEGENESWTEEFNYLKSANINNYLQAHLEPESNSALIKNQ